MAFCARFAGGPDICNNSTENYGPTDCGPGCWTALNDDLCFGIRELYGCQEGCGSCPDYPSEITGQRILEGGTRWLRPKERNRDARGKWHDLREGESHPINIGVVYEKAACFNQDGTECFNMSPCDCWPPPQWLADDFGCNGVPVGAVITSGNFPDAFTFVGNSWPNDVHHCRSFRERGPVTIPAVVVLNAGMPAPSFIRSNEVPGSASCMANGLVQCLDEIRMSNSCLGDWSREPTNELQSDFWNANLACRNMFNVASFDFENLNINVGGAFPFGDTATLGVKRAILRHTMTTTELQRFPGDTNTQGFDRVNRITNIDGGKVLWRKEWNLQRDCALAFGHQAPFVASYPNTHLVVSEATLTTEVRLLRVRMDVVLFAAKRSLGDSDAIEWHARCNLEIDTSWSVLGEGMQQRQDCWNLPVAPDGDRIVYRDNSNRPFRPPTKVVWQGYLGKLGATPTTRKAGGGDPISNGCQSIRNSFTGSKIEGWPVLKDSWPGDPARLYTGGMELRFTSPLCVGCNSDLDCGPGFVCRDRECVLG